MSSKMNPKSKSKEYTVEKILNKRLIRGVVHYKLKWLGFSDNENTWEPKRNMRCPALVEAFEMEWKAKRKEEGQCKGKPQAQKRGGSDTPKNPAEVKAKKSRQMRTRAGTEAEMMVEKKIKKEVKVEPEERAHPEVKKKMELRASKEASVAGTSSGSSNAVKTPTNKTKSKDNFSRFGVGYKPESVLGATRAYGNGELMYLMKFKGRDEHHLVLAEEAGMKCPELVIQYLEERISWIDHE